MTPHRLERATTRGDDDEVLDRLRSRLAVSAEDEGLLDVGHRVVDSPAGPLLVAVTDAGVVRVAFEVEDHEAVMEDLARTVGPRMLRSVRRTESVTRQLGEYFDGVRRDLDVSVDLRAVSGFRLDVLGALSSIPYGTTATYAEVAAVLGRPRAVRAVGTACSRNPVPLVVPCHRVVRSDGSVGGYLGGPQLKVALLERERGFCEPA